MSATTTLIHGDFNSRNLLIVGGLLSVVPDLEGTSLDERVADFALAWGVRRD